MRASVKKVKNYTLELDEDEISVLYTLLHWYDQCFKNNLDFVGAPGMSREDNRETIPAMLNQISQVMEDGEKI